MKKYIRFWLTSGVFLCCLLKINPSQAQITRDTTLPNNSNINSQGNTNTISGGTRAGTNLFHSFREFAVPTNGVVYFNNALDIQNIISRVTGSSISNIDGLIKANGAANLFLINPNGIIFGPNARLNIGGSFLGSTASRLNFADGNQFSASGSQTIPLLTISAPIGLEFQNNSAAIRVQGIGHDVTVSNYQPLMRGNSSTRGLEVQPGKTLALVGGNVSLQGGVLTAESGKVELGSVNEGMVNLNATDYGLSLGYNNISAFKDISLSQHSLIDASGTGSGSIQIQARTLQLNDASLILLQNQGTLPAGTLKVNASESLQIKGFDPVKRLVSGIWSETLGLGDGANISVTTPELNIQSSGQIFTATDGAAKAGNINFISKSLQIIGPLPNQIEGGVLVGSFSNANGNSGDITIYADQLNIANGGAIITANILPITFTSLSGKSGNIIINATNSVDVNGTALNPLTLDNPSVISAATFSNGRAGDVTINTSKLRVGNGARIDSSTAAYGTAGSVIINAQDSVDVSGVAPTNKNPSLITSGAFTVNQSLQNLLKLSNDPNGVSGKVLINTKHLSVTDGAQLSVENDGTKSAGSFEIEAKTINIDSSGSIKATTASGEGGNVFLNSQNLQSRHNSSITASAGGSGNGGNININTNTLAAVENSPITADAYQGRGGNIQINAQGIFQSPDSKFTASSNLGINGTVRVNTVVNTSTLGLVRLPIVPVDAAKLIAAGCGGNTGSRGNSFVVTGSGGFPTVPTELQASNTVWADIGADAAPISVPSERSDIENAVPSTEYQYKGGPLVEAQGWVTNSKGEIVMTANAPTYTPAAPWIKPPSCQVR